jgi:type IV pilus assembly protein PilM
MGSGAIKALKVENDGGELKVLDFAVIPHSRVLSTPELDQDDAMRVALGTLVSKHDLSGARIAVSIPGHQSFARFATLPPVEPKKVPDIVKFEAVQQIPFPLEEVEWDYQTFVSPDSPDIEVGIFAVTRQRIMDQLNMLADVGLTPDMATLSPVAAYNALAVDLSFTEDTPGTIILDIGTVASDLIIAEAGRVWVRTFPIGGHQFTEALVSAFKLSYSKAEKLKRESEQSKHARHVLQAMRPVFSDIVGEIKRSIDFYTSVHSDADLKRLVGLGSTFKLPGLRKYLKQQLQMDVYRLEQFKKLNMEGARAGEFQASSVNMATTYGCVIQAFEKAPLRANLMPVKVLKDAMWKRKTPYFAAAAGLAAAAAGAMFIRPLLDSTGLQGAEKPPIISNVISEAGLLANEARQAGVTSDARQTMGAAQIVDLVDDRALYAEILSDTSRLVGLVREGARSAASNDSYLAQQMGDRDPMRLVTLETTYMTQPADGAGSGGFGGRGAPSGGAQGDQALSRIGSMRRVKVEATFEIPVGAGEIDGYMYDIVEPALRQKLQESQDAYTIVASETGFWAAGATQGTVTTTRGGNVPTRVAVTDPGRSGYTGSSGGGSRDLESLAPLAPADAGQSAGVGSMVTLTWYAVLDLDPKAAGNNDEGEG